MNIIRTLPLILAFFISTTIFAQLRTDFVFGYGNILNIDPATPTKDEVALGLGKFFGSGITPAARLHINDFLMTNPGVSGFGIGELLRTDGDQSVSNFWRLYTGTTFNNQTERFSLFTGDGTANGLKEDINQRAATGDFYFRAFGNQTSGAVKERMHLTSRDYNVPAPWSFSDQNVTRTTISYGASQPAITTPWSMLHIGRDDTPSNIYRGWMNVGTSYTDNRDAMYVGMARDTGFDQTDAVIAWADNNAAEAGPDNLRFIFLAGQNPAYGQVGSVEGLEVGRFAPTGNFGVGNFYNSPSIPPIRRTEILDGGRNQPQLRLTHTQNSSVNQGSHVDLQAMNNGDLYIHPENNGADARVGINIATPGNTLEINSPTAHSSGLRFTDLTSASPTGSTTTKVLTVNGSGDVILRDVPGGGGDVSACSSIAASDVNYVPKWNSVSPTVRELCKSIIYDNGSQVGIGTTTMSQKLDVEGNTNLGKLWYGLYLNNQRFLVSEGSGHAENVYLGIDAGPPGLNINTGYGNIIMGRFAGHHLDKDESYNIFIGSRAGEATHGVYANNQASRNVFVGTKSGENNTTGESNTFLGHWAGNSTALDKDSRNVFVGSYSGSWNSDDGEDNVLLGYNTHLGIDAAVSNSVAIGANSWVQSDNSIVCGTNSSRILMGYNQVPATTSGINDFRLYVHEIAGGEAAFFDGDIYVTGAYLPSDATLKRNITDVQDVRSILDRLQPKTYEFDHAGNPALNLPDGLQYGLMADDLRSVLPGLVKEFTAPAQFDSTGRLLVNEQTFSAVNYTGLIPILLKVVKDQQSTLDSLNQVTQALATRLDRIESLMAPASGSHDRQGAIDVNLSSANAIILRQNDPNPFAEQTQITFNLPDEVQQASMVFSDLNGKILRVVPILERGEGRMNVYAGDLSSGIYTYSLIADGQVVDTKRMSCNK